MAILILDTHIHALGSRQRQRPEWFLRTISLPSAFLFSTTGGREGKRIVLGARFINFENEDLFLRLQVFYSQGFGFSLLSESGMHDLELEDDFTKARRRKGAQVQNQVVATLHQIDKDGLLELLLQLGMPAGKVKTAGRMIQKLLYPEPGRPGYGAGP
jgi:hypothetical protein